MEGLTVSGLVPECHVTFGWGRFIMFDEISISTIELPERRFQTFPDISMSMELRAEISLLEKLLGKSRRPKDKTIIRGANPGIPYQGRRRRGAGGHEPPPPHFQKWGAQVGLCPPPPLLGRANVLISLFAHILWLKTHFFFKIFLARFARQTLINQYFLNFANLKL